MNQSAQRAARGVRANPELRQAMRKPSRYGQLRKHLLPAARALKERLPWPSARNDVHAGLFAFRSILPLAG